ISPAPTPLRPYPPCGVRAIDSWNYQHLPKVEPVRIQNAIRLNQSVQWHVEAQRNIVQIVARLYPIGTGNLLLTRCRVARLQDNRRRKRRNRPSTRWYNQALPRVNQVTVDDVVQLRQRCRRRAEASS